VPWHSGPDSWCISANSDGSSRRFHRVLLLVACRARMPEVRPPNSCLRGDSHILSVDGHPSLQHVRNLFCAVLVKDLVMCDADDGLTQQDILRTIWIIPDPRPFGWDLAGAESNSSDSLAAIIASEQRR
jgi:hypothetical protein